MRHPEPPCDLSPLSQVISEVFDSVLLLCDQNADLIVTRRVGFQADQLIGSKSEYVVPPISVRKLVSASVIEIETLRNLTPHAACDQPDVTLSESAQPAMAKESSLLPGISASRRMRFSFLLPPRSGTLPQIPLVDRRSHGISKSRTEPREPSPVGLSGICRIRIQARDVLAHDSTIT